MLPQNRIIGNRHGKIPMVQPNKKICFIQKENSADVQDVEVKKNLMDCFIARVRALVPRTVFLCRRPSRSI